MSAAAIDSLGFHRAIIGLGVFIGYLIHGGLVRVELLVRPPSTDGHAFFDTFPLFPLCMNGWRGGAARFFANFTTRNPLDHRLMQRLSGTAMDFLVVAAISTINVEVVLEELVRCFHRPPGNSSPTRWSTAGGGGTRKPARDPIGYGREAMRWRMWSNWRQVSARSGGQSLKKYNRFDITDHHRSDMGPSKPRVAGSNPAGRAIFLKNSPIVPTAWGTGGESTGEKSDRSPSKIG